MRLDIQINNLGLIGQAPLLRDIRLSVEAGSVHTLMGPSGSGKSSLLLAIAGQLHAPMTYQGHIKLDAMALDHTPAHLRRIGMMFQDDLLYLDKPFSVGDWVRSPDRDIEGTVEDIGWRLTRIRTFDKRPLYIPNSMFSSIIVENPSRMAHRRIYENIGIRYEDAHVLHAVVNDVRAMLKSHPDIAQQQTQIVHFNAYAASHLEFMVYVFTTTTDWLQFHAIKEDVLTRIMAIVNQHGAQFAYPTQTLHIANEVGLAQLQHAQPPT